MACGALYMRSLTAALNLGRIPGLVSVLMGALGVHVAHPLLHPQERPTGCTCLHADSGAAVEQRAYGGPGESNLLPGYVRCTVCEFLALLNSAAPESVGSPAATEPFGPVQVPAGRTEPPVPALGAFSPRAPPVHIIC